MAHGLVTPTKRSRLLAPLAAYNKWTDSYDTNKLKGAASKFVNKDGRLYAPWLEQQVDDAATARSRSEREQRTKQKYAKAAADGLIGMSIEGASAELGGGGLRMNAKVVETPATAEEHGHVQLSWSNKGGNISIEKKQGGSWRSIASRASSPVVDSGRRSRRRATVSSEERAGRRRADRHPGRVKRSAKRLDDGPRKLGAVLLLAFAAA